MHKLLTVLFLYDTLIIDSERKNWSEDSYNTNRLTAGEGLTAWGREGKVAICDWPGKHWSLRTGMLNQPVVNLASSIGQ